MPKAGFEQQQKLNCGLTVGVISIHWSQMWAFVAEHRGSVLEFGRLKLFNRTVFFFFLARSAVFLFFLFTLMKEQVSTTVNTDFSILASPG